MAEFTINPIPFAGGTLQWDEAILGLIRLDTTRFIYAFSQSNPNYKFYGIADVPNVTASSPTVTIVKQRAYVGVFNSVKMTRLDDDRFVSLDGADLFVYNTSTDDVIEELKITDWGSTFNNLPATRAWQRNVGDGEIVDVTMEPVPLTTSFRVVVRTLRYNISTQTFSVSSPKILHTGVAITNVDRGSVKIEQFLTDSTKVLIAYSDGSLTGPFTITPRQFAIYNLNDDTLDIITPPSLSAPYNNAMPVAFAANSVVHLSSNASIADAIEYDGTTWSADFPYAGANSTDPINDTAILSPSYAMILRKPGGAGGDGGNVTIQDYLIRIINRQGAQSIVTSFPTNQGGGLNITLPPSVVLWTRRDIMDVFDPETVLLPGYNVQSAQKRFVVTRITP